MHEVIEAYKEFLKTQSSRGPYLIIQNVKWVKKDVCLVFCFVFYFFEMSVKEQLLLGQNFVILNWDNEKFQSCKESKTNFLVSL